MAHYQRNVRFLGFVVLPVLGFLLGWSLSQRNAESNLHLYEEATERTVNEPAEVSPGVGVVTEKPATLRLGKKPTAKNVDLDILWETWEEMENLYLRQDDFNADDQLYGAVRGMVDSLDDPYTVFLSPQENQEFMESLNGSFEGIGAEIEIKDDLPIIVAPLKGSPAELAGLKAGDIVTHIDETLTYGMSILETVRRIKGPKGTPVVLTVARENEDRPLDITIVRDSIVIETVSWELKEVSDGRFAHITVTSFAPDLHVKFQDLLADILLEQPDGIVMDLRNNGGGDMAATVKFAANFIENKPLVRTRGRSFGNSADITTKKGGALTNVPMVVLVNRGSASAAEILAGAIQDHARGVLVGETTFGKGTVQQIVDLSDGSSLKVTISEWRTPRNRSIHEVGISPDIDVELTDENTANGADPVFTRGIEVLQNEYEEQIEAREKLNISVPVEEE